jgi:methionyl-tRNA formyltransferase
MRIAFMGTPDFAARALRELAGSEHEVACVYSQPPKPRGRGQVMTASPVHALAEELGLPVRTPTSMRDPAEVEAFRSLQLDAAAVVAFGQILNQTVLDAPRLGCFNLHGSLLPRWRGAAPIQRALMAGDQETGVEVMRMTAGLDEGPVILSARVPITPQDTAGTLHDKMAEAGAPLLVRALGLIERGEAVETPQPEEGVTYARKISAAEAHIDWARPAAEVDAHIRGLSPFPGAWFTVEGPRGPVRVKVLMSEVGDRRGAAGTVLDDELLIGCAEGSVRLLRLQREGQRPQEVAEFVRGFPIRIGTVLA